MQICELGFSPKYQNVPL